MNRPRRTNLLHVLVLLGLAMAAVGPAAASEAVPKLVHLIVEDDELIASNVRGSRFDKLKLSAKEVVEKQAVAEAVIIVVTNQRIIGYSVYGGSWRPLRTEAGERILSVEVEDYSALVQTNRRWLNFNGKSGVWGKFDR